MRTRIATISQFDEEALSQVAQIHIAEVPSGFLTSLGAEVLTELYRTMARSEGYFIVAAISPNQEVLGFLAGSIGTKSLSREFLRLSSIKAKFVLALSLMSPRNISRMLETLQYSRKGVSDTDIDARAEILNFCVAKSGQRKGLGGQLINEAKRMFRDASITRVRVVTGHTQMSAQRFYRKMGIEEYGDLTVHKGTPSTMFIWKL